MYTRTLKYFSILTALSLILLINQVEARNKILSNTCEFAEAGFNFILNEIKAENELIEVNALIKKPKCFGENSGSISLSISNGIPPFTFEWLTGEKTPYLNNLIAGEYTVIITDGTGKKIAKKFFVDQAKELHVSEPIIYNPVNNLICNGTISLEITGGTSPYNYLWEAVMDIPGFLSGSFQSIHHTNSMVVEISGKKNLTIEGLDVYIKSGTEKINLYYTYNSFNNSDFESDTWIDLGSCQVNETSENKLNHIQFTEKLKVKENEKLILLIKTVKGGIFYENASNELDYLVQNADLSIINGMVQNTIDSKLTVQPHKLFSGNLYYSLSQIADVSSVSRLKGACQGLYKVLITDQNGCQINKHVTLNSEESIKRIKESRAKASSLLNVPVANQETKITANSAKIHQSKMSIYPNPTKNTFYIDLYSKAEARAEIILFDVLGKKVKSVKQLIYSGNNKVEFSTSALEKGVYLLKSSWGDESETFRMIIQ